MLQQWLRDRCVPAVATVVSGDADLICRKNNVNFEQLVRYHILVVAVCVHTHTYYQVYYHVHNWYTFTLYGVGLYFFFVPIVVDLMVLFFVGLFVF